MSGDTLAQSPCMPQLVVRRRPRLVIYWRCMPGSYLYPTEPQIKSRSLFAQAVRLAKQLSVREVAEIVGGEVYDEERQLVRMPDGRILPKTAALASHVMRGRVFSERPSHILYSEPRLGAGSASGASPRALTLLAFLASRTRLYGDKRSRSAQVLPQ